MSCEDVLESSRVENSWEFLKDSIIKLGRKRGDRNQKEHNDVNIVSWGTVQRSKRVVFFTEMYEINEDWGSNSITESIMIHAISRKEQITSMQTH